MTAAATSVSATAAAGHVVSAPAAIAANDPALRALKLALGLGFTATLLGTVWLMLADVPVRFAMECDRAAGSCWVERDMLARQRTWYFSLESLRDARVRSTRPARGSPRTLLFAQTDHGSYFVADYGPSGRQLAEADAAQVRLFLTSREAQFRLVREAPAAYWIAAATLLPAGLVLLWLWRALLKDVAAQGTPIVARV